MARNQNIPQLLPLQHLLTVILGCAIICLLPHTSMQPSTLPPTLTSHCSGAHNPLSHLPIRCCGVQEPRTVWQKQHDKGLLFRLWEDKSFYGLIITSWWHGRGSSDSNLVSSSPPSTKGSRGSRHLSLPALPVYSEIVVFESSVILQNNHQLIIPTIRKL